MNGSIGQVWVDIGTNLSALHTGLKQASDKLETWASQTRSRLKPFEESAAAMGVAAGAIALAVGGATKAFGDFQAKLNGVASVSGATATEIDKIRASALQMGADTQFSAAEAADGFYELGKAGFTANEQLGTMPGVIALAGAAQISIGESAETTAGILRGFGLEAGKATNVADQLAKAANSSAVDVADLGESMKYIAPIASASGQSLEEMNGILAVLGNNMIKGSQAGTSIRSMLVALQKPNDDAAAIMAKLGISIQDTQGRMLPMTDIVAQLREKMAGYTETQKSAALAQIFGQESLSAVMALMNQAPGSIEKTVKSMRNADGASKDMADGLNKGVNFQMQQLTGSIETLAIKFGSDLAPAMEAVIGALTSLVNMFAEMPAPLRVAILVAAGLTAGITALAAVIGGLSLALPAFTAGFQALGLMLNTTRAFVIAFNAAWGPWLLVAAGVAAAIGLISSKLAELHGDLDAATAAQERFNEASGKVAKDGGAAYRKHAQGIKLTADEARAATVHLRQLAAAATDPARKAKLQAQAKEMQALFDGLKGEGPARGAAVKDPNAGKKKKSADAAAARAVKEAKKSALEIAKANLDGRLADNADNKGGKAGELKALQAYRAELAKIPGTQGTIAALDKQIARTRQEQSKATKESNLDKAEEQLKRNLLLNDKFKGGIQGQINAYQTYLDQLKAAGATDEKRIEVEQKIVDLKEQQAKKQQDIIDKAKEAAMTIMGLFADGMNAAGTSSADALKARIGALRADLDKMKAEGADPEDILKRQIEIRDAEGQLGAQQGEDNGAIPGFLGANAGLLTQLPGMLTQISQGLAQALPALTTALPSLAPMLTEFSGALSGIVGGGLMAMAPIIAGIVAALTLFMMAWQKNAGGIQDAFGNLMASLGGLWDALQGFLMPIVDQLGAALAFVFNLFAVGVSIITAVVNAFVAVRDWAWNLVMGFEPLRAIIEGIGNVFRALWDALAAAVKWLTRGKVKLNAAGETAQKASQVEAAKLSQERYDAAQFEKIQAEKAKQKEQESLANKVGSATAKAVGDVLGAITSFNPLPVEDVSRSNLFSVGPGSRFFYEKSSRMQLDVNLGGDITPEAFQKLMADPGTRAAVAGLVGNENASVNLMPRFS